MLHSTVEIVSVSVIVIVINIWLFNCVNYLYLILQFLVPAVLLL